jgi:hypothetical protein
MQEPGRFLATLVGDSSFEVPVAKSAPQYEGIYTASFLSAFRHPDETMVRTIGGVRVVPNNQMKAYLEREVQRRPGAVSIQIPQVPDTQVVSGDTTYIGRVTGDSPQVQTTGANLSASLHDVASVELLRVGVRGIPIKPVSNEKISRVRNETGYANAAAKIRRPVDAAPLRRTGGIVLIGARLKIAGAHPSVLVEMLSDLRTAPTSDRRIRGVEGVSAVHGGRHGCLHQRTPASSNRGGFR